MGPGQEPLARGLRYGKVRPMFIPLHDQNALKSIRLQYVTLFLIFLNVTIWLITGTQQAVDSVEANSIFYSYGFVPAVVNDVAVLPTELAVLPDSASYITYAFLHGGFMHLAGNMLFLWVFGDNVEDAMGHFRFLVFYLICAAAGAWAHALILPNSEAPLIGASGAAAGVVGAYLMLHPRVKVWVLALGRIPLRLSALWVLGAWFAFQVFKLVSDYDGEVSWAAHVGGFIVGAALIVLFKRRGIPLFDADMVPQSSDAANATDKPRKTVKPTDKPRTWGRGES